MIASTPAIAYRYTSGGESINLYRKYRGHTLGSDPVGAATEACSGLAGHFLKRRLCSTGH